jgi:hypothetical protein
MIGPGFDVPGILAPLQPDTARASNKHGRSRVGDGLVRDPASRSNIRTRGLERGKQFDISRHSVKCYHLRSQHGARGVLVCLPRHEAGICD